METCRNAGEPEPKDCGGVNCPLGVAHPPASNDPFKAMYPLGCSLCRKIKPGKTFKKPANQSIKEVELDTPIELTDFEQKALQKLYQEANPLEEP